jgi:hypothetical protein
MKEITLVEFEKLPKKGPISGRHLEAGKLYYIRDSRNKLNPVYVGRYVKPVIYYNDNSVSYNYNFEDVEYLVNPSKYNQNPRNTYGNIDKYYEVLYPTPTKMDIKNKKSMMNELRDFIYEKKAEPHDKTPTISFMGKDYRKVRDKFNNRSTSKPYSSLSSSRSSRKRSSSRSSSKPSSSKTRSSRKSSRRSSSNRSYYRSSSSSYRSY